MSKSKRSGKRTPPTNPSKWVEVYERCATWAEITCVGEDHRDIMQDVIEKVLTGAPQDHPNPDAYFKVAIRNRYFTVLKERQKIMPDAVSTQSGTYQIAEVRDALSGIEAWKSGLFELHYIHGLGVPILARQIGLGRTIVYDAINEVAEIVKARLK